MAFPSTPELSIVIPAFNEEANVRPCYDELVAALAPLGRSFEVVFVDDGSTDGTAAALAALAAGDARVRVLRLRENAGQTAALDAGFRAVQGRVVVTMDADLQNDPADIPALLAALEHADVVSGVRATRRDDWVRRISSRVANGVRRVVLGDRITDIGCSLKAYRREVLEGLPMFVGVHRFLPALCGFRGSRVTEVQVNHRPRTRGVSKYGMGNRLWRGIHDLVGVSWLKVRLVRYRVRGE